MMSRTRSYTVRKLPESPPKRPPEQPMDWIPYPPEMTRETNGQIFWAFIGLLCVMAIGFIFGAVVEHHFPWLLAAMY